MSRQSDCMHMKSGKHVKNEHKMVPWKQHGCIEEHSHRARINVERIFYSLTHKHSQNTSLTLITLFSKHERLKNKTKQKSKQERK
ncbi:hypothetical protein E2C01_041388 [Portunus trituberculatus]|uniref:Uncharacterized protein n=1 Tax=Portunus trituberculatus TaxID=210409 RepID=A0A5B7FQM1_PORTR|nr:hypothetical protein [Portunus trituberculatus]